MPNQHYPSVSLVPLYMYTSISQSLDLDKRFRIHEERPADGTKKQHRLTCQPALRIRQSNNRRFGRSDISGISHRVFASQALQFGRVEQLTWIFLSPSHLVLRTRADGGYRVYLSADGREITLVSSYGLIVTGICRSRVYWVLNYLST